MEFNKLDDIYHIILDSKYQKLEEYDKESIDIVKKIKFPNLNLNVNKESTKYLKHGRINSYKFRNLIIEKFSNCAITNVNSKLCEAAHILPFCYSSDEERLNINNGILLSCNMHKAFDNNYFTINENTCKVIILHKNIKNHNIKDLKELNLETINNKYIPQLNNIKSKHFLSERNKKLNKFY